MDFQEKQHFWKVCQSNDGCWTSPRRLYCHCNNYHQKIYCKIVQDNFLKIIKDPHYHNWKNYAWFFLLQKQLKTCKIWKIQDFFCCCCKTNQFTCNMLCVMCDMWRSWLNFLEDSVSMSKKETNNFVYEEFNGFWVDIHNQTQVAVICTL